MPQISLIKPLLVFLIIGVAAVWALNAMVSGNPLWWFPVQPSYVPSRIIIKDAGEVESLARGSDRYRSVADGLDSALADFRSRALVDIGLSDQTLADYEVAGLVVEVRYENDIRFNLPMRMVGINQLLIPIEGRHAGRGYVFLGTDGRWRAGALQVESLEPLEAALRQLGYLDDS